MIREIRCFLLFAKYDSLNTPSLPLGGLGWVFPFGRVGVGISLREGRGGYYFFSSNFLPDISSSTSGRSLN